MTLRDYCCVQTGKVTASSLSGGKSTGKTRRNSKIKGSSAKDKLVPANNKVLTTRVIDTNVIMDSWDSIFKFGNDEVCIVSQVWQELDDNKKGYSQVSWNVRKATRVIDSMISNKTHKEIMEGIVLTPPPEIRNGREHTGKLIFFHFVLFYL